MEDVVIEARPVLTDVALNTLFAAAWPEYQERAFGPILARSLAWFGATRGGELIGFVNVAWDGGDHAFLLDPTVHPDHRRRGLGLALVRAATRAAAEGGAEWLHVDYDAGLEPFYTAAGFWPTPAGLIRLAGP